MAEASNSYFALTEAQQALLSDAMAQFEALFAVVNGSIAPLVAVNKWS